MSVGQAFEAGLADYLVRSDGKNVTGATLPAKMPVSAECNRHVVDIHSGGGGFTLKVYCNMNGPSDRQLVAPAVFPGKLDFAKGIESYETWMRSLRFRVESPPLKVGGVYDSYEFVTDGSAKVVSISTIQKAP
jgi:hypothetical protein